MQSKPIVIPYKKKFNIDYIIYTPSQSSQIVETTFVKNKKQSQIQEQMEIKACNSTPHKIICGFDIDRKIEIKSGNSTPKKIICGFNIVRKKSNISSFFKYITI
jgi:hypothetical protein